MAWTQPSSTDWLSNQIITRPIMNVNIRDNFRHVGDVHAHGSSTGEGAGSQTIGPLVSIAFATAAAPSTAGSMHRVGAHVQYFGTELVRITEPDAASTEASPRTLGTGANQAARGNHAHAAGEHNTPKTATRSQGAFGVSATTYVTQHSSTHTSSGVAALVMIGSFAFSGDDGEQAHVRITLDAVVKASRAGTHGSDTDVIDSDILEHTEEGLSAGTYVVDIDAKKDDTTDNTWHMKAADIAMTFMEAA